MILETRSKYQETRRRYRAANPSEIKRYNRRAVLRQYGITEAHFAYMMGVQGGVCAICGAGPETCRGGYLAVDHDHSTGIVRGLLCTKCNAGLGQFGDDAKRLSTAILYVERHRGPPWR